MLRSKTQVVDDTIPTKTSLKAVHNEGCAFTTAFTHIPNSSQLQVPSHAPTTVHQQRTDKTNRPNTIFMQQAVACHPEDQAISAVVQLAYERRAERGCCARRSYASCTTAEIFRSSGWHATACCMNLVKSAPAKPGQKTQALSPAQSAPVHFWPANRCRSTWLAGSAGAGGVSGWRGVAGSEPLNPFGPSGDKTQKPKAR